MKRNEWSERWLRERAASRLLDAAEAELAKAAKMLKEAETALDAMGRAYVARFGCQCWRHGRCCEHCDGSPP